MCAGSSQYADELDALRLVTVAAVETLDRVVPMLVDAEASHRVALAVAVGRARRRRGDEGGLVQVVLHAQVAVERGVARHDRRLVDEEIGAHRVERHAQLPSTPPASAAAPSAAAPMTNVRRSMRAALRAPFISFIATPFVVGFLVP